MKNKLLITIITLLLMSNTLASQSINYSYDATGNRVSRLQLVPYPNIPPIAYSAIAENKAGALPHGTNPTELTTITSNGIDELTYVTPQKYKLNKNLPVGATPYTYKVNPNGSSAFSIPLSLPQGRGEMTPQISINYNSMAGDGILGYGMNLSCISSITRCGKQIFYDGKNSAEQSLLSGAARFELDGMRLIKHSTKAEYIKEIDDFSRIKSYSSLLGDLYKYFEVHHKDGLRSFYGDYNHITASQRGKDPSSDGRIAWYLSHQQDAHGNSITYQYEKNIENADIWLTSITYNSSYYNDSSHYNEINFIYKKNKNAQEGYFLGNKIKRDKILKEIVIQTDGITVSRYTFDYLKPTDIYSNQSPRLHTITEYGAGGTIALNPLRIEWGERGERLFNAEYTYSQNSDFIEGDFNGDGCMDLLTIYDLTTSNKTKGSPRDYLAVYRYANPNGFSNELTITTFANQYKRPRAVAGDFNGDGLDDIFFNTSSGYEYWQTSLAQNNVPRFIKQAYKPKVNNTNHADIVTMADVNGDGTDELVVDNAYFDKGSTTGTKYKLAVFDMFYTYMVGDLDGDGCQDIIVCNDKGDVKVSSPAKDAVILNRGFGWNGMLGPNSVLLCGNFNNDKYLDFLMVGGYNSITTVNEEACIYYNSGDGKDFIKKPIFRKTYNRKYVYFRTGDFNGDGLTDVMSMDANSMMSDMENNQSYVSGGSHVDVSYAPDFGISSSSLEYDLFLSQETGGTPGVDGVYHRYGKQYVYPSCFYPIVADFSGDGKCDLVNVCEFRSSIFDSSHPAWLTGSTSLKLLCLSHQSTSDVVTGIKNGDGTKRITNYKLTTTAMRNPKFYNGMYADWNKELPCFNTVSSVKLGNIFNDSLVENKSYAYATPAYAKKGRRIFQGFGKVVCCDSISGDKITNQYTIAHFSGYPHYYQSRNTREVDTLYLSQSYNIGFKLAFGKYSFPYISITHERDYLKDVYKKTNFGYDNSGNMISKATYYMSILNEYSWNHSVVENMTYVACSAVSSFPCRMSSYKKTNGTKTNSIITDSKTYTYNAYGDIMTESKHGMTKSYAYNTELGILTSDTVKADGKERISHYEYNDDFRYVKKTTDPMGKVTHKTQDAFGNTLSETTSDGRTTTYQYDAFGKLIKTLSHEQVPTEYKYTWADSDLSKSAISLCNQQTLYDGILTAETITDCHGRTLMQSDLQPGNKWKHQRSTYNKSGLLSKEEMLCGSETLTPLTTAHYTYDKYQRLMQEDHRSADETALNKQVYYTYDGHTETRRIVTDKENTEISVYDDKWNITSKKDTIGTTLYTYDAADRLIEVVSPGYPITVTYNDNGLCDSVSNPASGTTTYTYNGFDELATKKDANNNITTYAYDLAGIITEISDDDRTISYIYNNKGQLINKSTDGHNTVYTYTPGGLLQKESRTIKDRTFTKNYTYDSKGRQLSYTSPSGLVQKYLYDAAHNIISIVDSATNIKLWEAKSYNNQGLLTADVNCGNKQTSYSYNLMGQYKRISNSLVSIDYKHNIGGLIRQRIEKFDGSELTETFDYDAGGRLINSTISNKEPITVSYGNGSSINAKSDIGNYIYNEVGAPLIRVVNAQAYLTEYQTLNYYKNNLPRTVKQTGYTRIYEYNANNQRDYSELLVSTSNLPFTAGKRYYFDDFEQNICARDSVITNLDYIFASGRLVALVLTANGNKSCYGALTDHQSSLISLYTNDGIVQKFSYDAWGNRRNPLTGAALTTAEIVAASSITSLGYTGHEHIDEMGLINMNARIYDPKLGMFISVDPKADSYLDTYPYAYCAGDPVNRVDPTGEDWYQDKNGNLFWQEGHKNIAGYANIGATVSIQWWDDLFFNAYQNAGIMSNNPARAFDLIYSSHKLQNQFLGKESPLSEQSKSELLNALVSRSIDGYVRPIGEFLVPNAISAYGGALAGKGYGLLTKTLSRNANKGKSIGEYIVYRGRDANNNVRYVGITKREPIIRFNEHKMSKTNRSSLHYKEITKFGKMPRTDARIIEQQLINQYGLGKNGGQLYNRINSISPKYWEKYNIKW